ncbi:MAG TPA: NAD(P)/FAD-dependent oxidoreductase [Pseudomonadales bacterium]|nr:NAD(P)/FAD-dependent oxidoreductase [Pseudomonadales bacterium]
MRKTQIAIIGTGFGGVGMAIQLKKAGITDFVILEKRPSVGGVWRENHYPGAACDIPSHLYSFSFERNPNWSRRFSPQAEILAYLQHCVDKYAIAPHIEFNCEVTQAEFREDSGTWLITSADGKEFGCKILITATGQLNRPAYPTIPGQDHFQGITFHSACWDENSDLSNKRIGVIGTGASAIQFVPELQKIASQLTIFQRSAPYVFEKPDRAYWAVEKALMRLFPFIYDLNRLRIFLLLEARLPLFTFWRGGMAIYNFLFKRFLKESVQNPFLRDRLIPDYELGCKRILLSNDYYPAIDKPNVEVVTSPIKELTAHSAITDDGRQFELDAIVYGTGFAASDFLAPMKILGRGGLDLNREWKNGAEAYLGMTVHGFPNLFMMYGPNTNLGHNSIVYMLECQMDYILQCIDNLRGDALKWIDVKKQVQRDFNTMIQDQAQDSVWQSCSSWYKNKAGKNTNNWTRFCLTYRKLTKQLMLQDYELT